MATQWQVVVHELKVGGSQFEARVPLFIQDPANVARLFEYYGKVDPLRMTYYIRAFEILENAELNLTPEEYFYV